MRDRKLVVAGLILGEGRVLITQRRADQALPLQWEFPGGKVEPGEAPVAALVRELREEIGVEVADLRWVPPAGLTAYEVLPADVALVQRLAAEAANR